MTTGGDDALTGALGERTIQQAFDLWINPEIERRRSAGVIPGEFALYAAQIIMNVGLPAVVRLNDEIKGVLRGTASGPVEKGQMVRWDHLSEIHHIELTTHDANAGHMTLLLHKGRWFLQFDFRYNAQRVAETLSAAREFVAAARYSCEQGHVRAFCENLFGATELLAKGNLLMIPDEGILKSKKHDYVAANYNRWGKAGNADPRFAGLLNQLGRLRSSARYVSGEVKLTPQEMSTMLDVAGEMLKRLETEAPSRAAV